MFIKYNGKYYCSRTVAPVQQIWRYNTKFRFFLFDYLCKEQLTVSQEDFDEIFSATFWTTWNGRSCRVEAIKGRRLMKLTLLYDDVEFAKEHGFRYSEKNNNYYKIVPTSSATEFSVLKNIYIPKKEFDGKGFYETDIQSIKMSKDEWIDLFSELSRVS